MNELALFAGAGGGILGGHLLGWRTICAVEWEAYPASVLCARQNDGLLESFPIWDDVQTFDGKPWRGIVDVVSGGFPCTDISAAGKGAGIDGEASGMWREMARIIHEVRPRFVFVENSPMLTSRGLGRVLGDLAAMGFDARWGVLGAADIGANHQRDRIWIFAKRNRQISHSMHNGFGWGKQQPQSLEEETFTDTRCKSERPHQKLRPESQISVRKNASIVCGEISNSTGLGQQGQGQHEQPINSTKDCKRKADYVESIGTSYFWAVEPNVGRVADGVAARVDRLKAIGNGQVPLCAATAWRILNDQD